MYSKIDLKKDDKLLLSPKELTKVLGVSLSTAYNLCKSKTFPSFKIGGNYYVSLENLKKWIDLQIQF